MSSVRERPPLSIITEEQFHEYVTLYDDISSGGTEILTEDRHALAELAISLVEIRACRKDIEENGSMVKTKSDRNADILKVNPNFANVQKLQVHIKSMFKEFNMTPNSRSKPQGFTSPNQAGKTKEEQEYNDI